MRNIFIEDNLESLNQFSLFKMRIIMIMLSKNNFLRFRNLLASFDHFHDIRIFENSERYIQVARIFLFVLQKEVEI